MDYLPFSIKVNAVITRANGDREDLGIISSTKLGTERDNNTDNADEKQIS